MIIAASPRAMPVPCLRHAYSPVSSAYRDGVQVAEGACASVKRIPLLRYPVNVRCGDGGCTVTAYVTVTQVVCIDEDDIGGRRGGSPAAGQGSCDGQKGGNKPEVQAFSDTWCCLRLDIKTAIRVVAIHESHPMAISECAIS